MPYDVEKPRLMEMNPMNIVDFFDLICLRFLEMKEGYDSTILEYEEKRAGSSSSQYEKLL